MSLVRKSLLLLSVALVFSHVAGAQDAASAKSKLSAMGLEVSIDRLVQYAAQGDENVVKLLLEAGVDVTAADPQRQVTALHNAAAQGHLKLVQLFLDKGASVDAQDWNGSTPLIFAAGQGKVDVMKVLLARGAKVDVKPKNGPTALVAAVYAGNAQAIRMLLEAGANPNQADAFGNTPVKLAELGKRTEILAVLTRK